MELLSNAGLLPSEAHEQSRILAAEFLGSIAQTDAAKEALAAAESSRWRSSEPLRVAAENARKRLTKMPQNPWAVPQSASGAPPPASKTQAPPPSKTNAPPAGPRPSVGPEKGRK